MKLKSGVHLLISGERCRSGGPGLERSSLVLVRNQRNSAMVSVHMTLNARKDKFLVVFSPPNLCLTLSPGYLSFLSVELSYLRCSLGLFLIDTAHSSSCRGAPTLGRLTHCSPCVVYSK